MRERASIAACVVILLSGCSSDTPERGGDISEPPFAVGSATFFIHDESRSYDSVAGVDAGIRTLITEIWYPADADEAAKYQRATYGDYVFGNKDMHRLMMTGTTFFHATPDSVRDGVSQAQIDEAIDELFDRERGSWIGVPPTGEQQTFPVVVMSHGDAGSRYNMESVCEYLAAHGYFVIAAEHTGNSPYSMTGSDPALSIDEEFSDKMAEVLPLLNEHGAYGPDDNYGQSYSPLLGE